MSILMERWLLLCEEQDVIVKCQSTQAVCNAQTDRKKQNYMNTVLRGPKKKMDSQQDKSKQTYCSAF